MVVDNQNKIISRQNFKILDDQVIDDVFNYIDNQDTFTVKKKYMEMQVEYLKDTGIYSIKLSQYVNVKQIALDENKDLQDKDNYVVSDELSQEVRNRFKDDRNRNYLFWFEKQTYEVNEDEIDRQQNQIEDKQTLKKQLQTFVHLMSFDIQTIQKKKDLSNLMDKLINWKKLTNNLKNGVINMMRVDDNLMNNPNIIFHQIPNSTYDDIFIGVIKKQIDMMNDELGQICGLNLTKET